MSLPGSRHLTRAEKTGRWVPKNFIEDAYANIPKNFKRVMRAANSWSLYDNRGAKARLIWSGDAGKESVHDATALAKLPE